MVRAILDGRKTQTRRVIAKPPSQDSFGYWNRYNGKGITGVYHSEDAVRAALAKHFCPHGVPGDRLWVRETFAIEGSAEGNEPPFRDGRPALYSSCPDAGEEWQQPHYRATDPTPDLDCCNPRHEDHGGPCPHPWRPSIFMPRWASRITLEITDVRVQRVQEISEDDARAEGVDYPGTKAGPIAEFAHLWDSINAKRGFGWDTNPWVWAITFKRVQV